MWSFLGTRSKAAPPAHNRRKRERFATSAMLRCALGEVADLSPAGMRVVRNGKTLAKVGQVLPLTIRSVNQQLAVQGRVVRLRRIGLRRYELGVRFVDVSPSVAGALEAMARYGFVDSNPATVSQFSARNCVANAQAELYRVLGVPVGSSPQTIRTAYRALAVKYHPDHNHEPNARLKFQEIHEAYAALRQAHRRQDPAATSLTRAGRTP